MPSIDIEHPDDRHTILAALRFYQERGQGDPANRSDAIHEIATNSGDAVSLDAAGIDRLCEYINCGPAIPADAVTQRIIPIDLVQTEG